MTLQKTFIMRKMPDITEAGSSSVFNSMQSECMMLLITSVQRARSVIVSDTYKKLFSSTIYKIKEVPAMDLQVNTENKAQLHDSSPQ
jgi:hypothetical protein